MARNNAWQLMALKAINPVSTSNMPWRSMAPAERAAARDGFWSAVRTCDPLATKTPWRVARENGCGLASTVMSGPDRSIARP